MNKLWHDDIRRPPDETWNWARTNQAAYELLLRQPYAECSLDHDLGLSEYDPDLPDADMQRGWDKENDGCDLVIWMIEKRLGPPKITIHSWNPIGAARMANLLRDHGYNPIVRPYKSSNFEAEFLRLMAQDI